MWAPTIRKGTMLPVEVTAWGDKWPDVDLFQLVFIAAAAEYSQVGSPQK